MRGNIIFALATLVVPTLTAAVPLIDTTSLNVEPDVKRHVGILNTDQAKRTTGPERLPIIEVIKRGGAELVERGGVVWGGHRGGGKRNAEPTGQILERGGVAWGGQRGGSKRDTEELVERGGVVWGGHRGGGKRNAEPTGQILERGGVAWGGQRGGSKRDTEELVERGGVVWGGHRGGGKRNAELAGDLIK